MATGRWGADIVIQGQAAGAEDLSLSTLYL